ncbi:MAG TPA: type I-F CRISPR-associated protein Csy1 [Aeromonadales bacterium]|nr:type I-F CRISPR-associated protein Csy1 [Aeromonadales bacterium]
MSEEQSQFQNWEQVIVHFFETKMAQSKLYKANDYVKKKQQEIKPEKDSKKKDKLISAKNKKLKELQELRGKAPLTEIREWLNKITDKENKKAPIKESHKISKATHVLKFSHSSAEAASIELKEKSDDLLLTTSSLKKRLVFDLAHNDGALISISRFLGLSLHQTQIVDLINNNEFDFLKAFKANDDEFNNWKEVLKNVVHLAEIKTADKAKQIYFPLTTPSQQISIKDTVYHLITPLFPSSLAEELFLTIDFIKYGEEQKSSKEQAKQEKDKPARYHPNTIINYTNLGIQNFGGEYPRNVSMLNADRGGRAYLFSSQPPTWQSQLKAPVDKESLFDYFSTPSLNNDIHYLREYLLRFERLGLSIKDPTREEWIVSKVQEDNENGFSSIIDEVLFYVGSIQNLRPGWTDIESIKLKDEHQYFLDPYRDDKAFQNQRKTRDWQSVIRHDFAQWLKRKLAGDKQFTPQHEHTRLWQRLFATPLREHCEMIELKPENTAEETQA